MLQSELGDMKSIWASNMSEIRSSFMVNDPEGSIPGNFGTIGAIESSDGEPEMRSAQSKASLHN